MAPSESDRFDPTDYDPEDVADYHALLQAATRALERAGERGGNVALGAALRETRAAETRVRLARENLPDEEIDTHHNEHGDTDP